MASNNLTALLAPLYDWCLLPVMCASSEILLPLGLSKGIMLQTPGLELNSKVRFSNSASLNR
jgi:hypothetical protein